MRWLSVVGVAALVLVAVMGVSAGAGGVGGGGQARADRPVARAAQEEDEQLCHGGARWPLKVMSDHNDPRDRVDDNLNADVIKLNEVQPQSVAFMRGLTAPDPLKPIRVKNEMQVYRLAGVRLRKMKHEADGDIHLVIADPVTKGTMIVEFPDKRCLEPPFGSTRADARDMMNAARRKLRRRCGAWPSDHFKKLRGTATIDGVAFFDRLHGQSGVAPNGIELHPVLAFTHAKSCRPR